MSAVDSEVVAALRAAGCVFAEEEARLLREAADHGGADLPTLVAARCAGTPVEYLVGWAEFHGLRVAVRPGVFVPRRRTVFLVEEALALAGEFDEPVVVDLCCGSGALGLALATASAARGRGVELVAADIDPVAVACARDNLRALGATVARGDLFDALPRHLRARVDILLCNTPYVPTEMIARMPPEARDHEPRRALDGGADGLDVLRRVAADAATWLRPGGWLLVEEGRDQAPSAVNILEEAGFTARIRTSRDHDATIVVACAPAPRTFPAVSSCGR